MHFLFVFLELYYKYFIYDLHYQGVVFFVFAVFL